MTKEKRYQLFIEQAIKLHGNKFDYSKSDYVKQKTPIQIKCPIHGEFYQTPEKHIAKNSKGCPECWFVVRSEMNKNFIPKKKEILCKEKFLEKCNKKFSNKYSYDLTDYTGVTGETIKITCPIHGEFRNKPINHIISGTGCPKCGLLQKDSSKTYQYDETIEELTKQYGGDYEYPEYNKKTYKNRRSSIDIICKKHGLFKKSVQKHLSGQACYQCCVEKMIEDNILVGGYSEKLFSDKPELINLPAILYYLKINNGEFYKIGISRICTENRIKALKWKSFGDIKNIEILKEWKDSLYSCFHKEQKILSDNQKFRRYEKWSTELFDRDVLNIDNQHYS